MSKHQKDFPLPVWLLGPRGEKDEQGNKLWNSWLFDTWKYALFGINHSVLSWFTYGDYGRMEGTCGGCENKKAED